MYDGRIQRSASRFPFQDLEQHHDILLVEDAAADMNFDHWISRISAGLSIEKKYKSSFFMSYNLSPKIVMNSNYIPQGSGGVSEERRKKIVEINPYFNKKKTPYDEFGHRLFDDWSEEEWHRFYAFIIKCIQLYFEHGIVEPAKINIRARSVIEKTNFDFYTFFNAEVKKGASWNKKLTLEKFKNEFPDQKRLTQNLFTKWIKFYLDKHELKYEERSKESKTDIVIV